MSNVRCFLYWFCLVLLEVVWVDDIVRRYTLYDGTLTGIVLILWLSISIGSIVFLCSQNMVSVASRFIGIANRLLVKRLLRRKRIRRPTTIDLSLR